MKMSRLNSSTLNTFIKLRRLLLAELENFIKSESHSLQQSAVLHSKKNGTDICDTDPQKCRDLFYVSEVDMLKALRYALYRESTRTGDPLTGTNLTALHSFVSLLADHFPVSTSYENKEAAGNPFATNSDWDHCRGSTGQYRGYTCGLWIAFHALTVSASKQAEDHLSEFKPLEPLKAIRAWIGSFFGCWYCREHFQKMTTITLPMETQVRNPEDVFMYLWKAHNIVNARLQGRDTEDPLYPKLQFPAKFLCPNCTADGLQDKKQIRDFLVNYYSKIKPFHSPKAFLI
ncbi:Erv1 / Alr family protein [Dictyocaulus viviparus]|uniref:Sulfhydryl oxidase n=1 Tax=Dictyocaulus viviparus TaxID=29172 RepID=A0A0D8XAW0_DICVI|nr:Erv1 / Alr family protein [Dictyocaulus viviparus]